MVEALAVLIVRLFPSTKGGANRVATGSLSMVAVFETDSIQANIIHIPKFVRTLRRDIDIPAKRHWS